MSTIRLRRAHRLTTTTLRDKAESIARRIEQRHAVAWHWEGDAMELVAPAGVARGVRGRVTIGDEDVAIEIHLPLALSPARRMVEKQLAAKLDALLGAA